SYQTKINLERPNWDAADYYFKEDYTIVPKLRAVVYRDWTTWLKTFTCSSTIRAWRLGSGQRMTKEEAKTSSLRNREKTTDQKDPSKSRKLCWRKNKRY
ncbi:hypothetical protein Tco_0243967, partial [Tanacetum coccineum]